MKSSFHGRWDRTYVLKPLPSNMHPDSRFIGKVRGYSKKNRNSIATPTCCVHPASNKTQSESVIVGRFLRSFPTALAVGVDTQSPNPQELWTLRFWWWARLVAELNNCRGLMGDYILFTAHNIHIHILLHCTNYALAQLRERDLTNSHITS